MTFSEWKKWLIGYPWDLRWFIIMVLIRPIIDNLYFLKNISPILSPPYIVGVLTPIFCLYGIYKYNTKNYMARDTMLKMWFVLVGINTFCFMVYDPLNFVNWQFVLKLLMPVYLYFFIKILIRTKRDLEGILQTFLYSGIYVVVIFLYEILVSPIRVEASRGLERIQGNFADVMNYGIYIGLGFISAGYFFTKSKKDTKDLVIIIGVTVLCMLTLMNIHHAASYGTFMVLAIIFFYYNFKTVKVGAVILFIGASIAGLTLMSDQFFSETIEPVIKNDIEVYEGDRSEDQLLHGRVGRWKSMIDDFFRTPILSQMFGMPTSFANTSNFISTAVHSDFFRISFFTGFVGIMFYLLYFFRVVLEAFRMHYTLRYLVLSCVAFLLLYSFTTTPTFYVPILYITLSVFCYVNKSSSHNNG